MSVIRFENDRWASLEKSLVQAFHYHSFGGAVESAVQYSGRMFRDYYWAGQLDGKLPVVGEIAEAVIGRLCWYCKVANRVAFALQYREEPDFFGDTGEYEKLAKVGVVKVLIEPRQLSELLASVVYNLNTNDSNYFLADEWMDLLVAIRNRLDAWLASPRADVGSAGTD